MPKKNKRKTALSSGSIGSSTGAMEYTKGYIKRKRKHMRDEEKRWQSLNGPVIIIKPFSANLGY